MKVCRLYVVKRCRLRVLVPMLMYRMRPAATCPMSVFTLMVSFAAASFGVSNGSSGKGRLFTCQAPARVSWLAFCFLTASRIPNRAPLNAPAQSSFQELW